MSLCASILVLDAVDSTPDFGIDELVHRHLWLVSCQRDELGGAGAWACSWACACAYIELHRRSRIVFVITRV